MSDSKPLPTIINIPKWFWIVSALALIWNLVGVMAYIGVVTITPEQFAEFSEAEQALYSNIPAWATSAFAIGVFGGVLGCLLLLLRRSLSFSIFILSLLGVLSYNFYFMVMKNSLAITGMGNLVLQALVVGIGIFLIWFARASTSKGWLQ